MVRRIVGCNAAHTNSDNIPGSQRWSGAWNREAALFRGSWHAPAGLSSPLSGARINGLASTSSCPKSSRGAWALSSMVANGSPSTRTPGRVRRAAARGPAMRLHFRPTGFAWRCVSAPSPRISRPQSARIAEQIALTAHSAGGHFVTRMFGETSPFERAVKWRIVLVLLISSRHYLGSMADARLTTWVGQTESVEFLRKSELLSTVSTGLGCACASLVEFNRHNFDVVNGPSNLDHPIFTLVGRFG